MNEKFESTNKYIYLLTKSESDYEGQDTEDLITVVTNNFKDIIENFYSTDSVFIVKNKNNKIPSELYELNLNGKREFLYNKIQEITNDEDETNYIIQVSTELFDRRENIEKQLNEERKRKKYLEEKEEYERLKKIYGNINM